MDSKYGSIGGVSRLDVTLKRLCVSLDPFADGKLSSAVGGGGDELIHIRIQQRNGRKTLTTVQGIHEKFDKKKIVKWCKKVG